MNKWLKYAKAYAIASIFIGPFIVFFLGSSHPSGWDCADPSWGNSVSLAEREAIYEQGSRLMGPAAILMLLVGVLILSALFFYTMRSRAISKAILPSLLVLLMMLGYGLIILLATSSWC